MSQLSCGFTVHMECS